MEDARALGPRLRAGMRLQNMLCLQNKQLQLSFRLAVCV